jgi:hypothetical protein
MEVHSRNDQNTIVFSFVDDAVRKTGGAAPSNFIVERAARFWLRKNSANRSRSSSMKSNPKPGTFPS